MKRILTACLALCLACTVLLHASLSRAERVYASREYFENLDRESSLEDIVAAAGDYYIQGSGIFYFTWPLADGGNAKVVFDSQGRIVMIYLTGENGSEQIYKREYPETGGSGAAGDGIRRGYVSASWIGRRISGVPSCASTAPSVNSTSECTMLCRWIAISI